MVHELTGSRLSATAEDYLKAIYAIGSGQTTVTIGSLAERLGVTAPSVSGMVRRLAEQKYLTHEPYHGVTLTELGRHRALETLRRHRVIETYLASILGYSWDRVHAEAERLEHAASDELIDRMAEALGQPTTDPHGAPIPTRDGSVDETVYRPLETLEVEESGRVMRVIHEDAAMLRYLDELGLRPGAEVRVTARAPFGGPMTVEVYGSRKFVAPSLAAQVLVTMPD
ncbi:MAG TPA: metal-dependent transcriptional regulator [Gemmatimonadaceae bacterium]|nr:metal-dependent transcriptional regulator [Gemmatimonadaceae bacterium]